MRELLESGEYFKQSRLWYNQRYLHPFIARSEIAVIFGIIAIILFLLCLNINSLFPLNKQMRYAIEVEDTEDYSAAVTKADFYENDVGKSISRIFLATYIDRREGYEYADLADRMLYVQNTSTKVLYNKYNNYLSLDNPDSPVIRFQKYARRSTQIKTVDFSADDQATIVFNARAIEDNGKILEDTDWEASISFVIDKIDISLPENTPFNFIVSDYKVKFIRDNNVK